MQTPRQYAKSEAQNGRVASFVIEPGQCGTFWLHDADHKMLDAPAYMSRDKAAAAKAAAVRWADKFWPVEA